MEIIIRSTNKKFKDDIPKLIDEAILFLKLRYPNCDFDNVRYIFGKGKRSRYFRNNNNDNIPTVYINNRAKWITYKMKSLKVYSDSIFVGALNQMLLSLIHELTHHIQYELDLPKGEKLTTLHELEYCKAYMSEYYKKLTKI